jgi:NTE family protein
MPSRFDGAQVSGADARRRCLASLRVGYSTWVPVQPPSSIEPSARRVGLVLGAGGATGAAFHAGTLLALHHDIGWNPNSADVIVGSSAGSIVGGLLRAGLSTDDLAAWGTRVEALLPGRDTRRTLDQVRDAGHQFAPSLPRPQLPSPSHWRALLPSSRLRLHTALLTLLPDGWIDAGQNLERVGQLLDEWPPDELWVTSVRLSDARRVVFGRDDIDITPAQAIAASCAIPGMYTPVTVGSDRYIDGGTHSPTNADLLLDAGVETAVILSPMSAQQRTLLGRPDALLRMMCRRRLRAECEQLVRAGVHVHVFEPDASTLESMGTNALAHSRAPRVIRDAFLAAGARIAVTPDLSAALSQQRTEHHFASVRS